MKFGLNCKLNRDCKPEKMRVEIYEAAENEASWECCDRVKKIDGTVIYCLIDTNRLVVSIPVFPPLIISNLGNLNHVLDQTWLPTMKSLQQSRHGFNVRIIHWKSCSVRHHVVFRSLIKLITADDGENIFMTISSDENENWSSSMTLVVELWLRVSIYWSNSLP